MPAHYTGHMITRSTAAVLYLKVDSGGTDLEVVNNSSVYHANY